MAQHPQRRLQLVWVPGHHGVEGNERADMEAKRAATDPTLSQSFNHSPLKSSRLQYIKVLAKTRWEKEWTENTIMAKQLWCMLIKGAAQRGPKVYNNIANRGACAKLIQLPTGHCGLNNYLHRFEKRNSPYCECGYGKETVAHFVLECHKYKE